MTLSLNKYHIHIYKVVGLIEVDVSAKDDDLALQAAIDTLEQHGSTFKPSDCNIVAVIPEETNETSTDG